MNKNYDRYCSHLDPGFIAYYNLHSEREKNVSLIVKDLLFHSICMKCFHFYKNVYVLICRVSLYWILSSEELLYIVILMQL
jgi:hypothetical protein